MKQAQAALSGKDSAGKDEVEGLIQHSVKRVKKKINDFILNNYNTLFFDTKGTPQSKDSPMAGDAAAGQTVKEGAQTLSKQTLSAEDILSNTKLI